jgi:hypothetical protein
VGTAAQQITVTGEAEAVETASATLGTVVESRSMAELPLASRNYTNLLSLSAGASAVVTNASGLGKSTQSTAVNGATTMQNNYQMDGASVNANTGVNDVQETSTRSAFGIPSPDAIQEFKIQTSQYDAGYGRNAGANVNIVTKSGTNQFHGTAFEFLRNTLLNANDWIRNATGAPRAPDKQNQYGGVFGGPVKKDKLFFFVSFQQTGQVLGSSAAGGSITYNAFNLPAGPRGTCPSGATSLSACDAATQTFVGELGAMYNPAGGTAGGLGAPVAVNGTNINPVAVQLLQLKLANGAYYIPTPNGASTAPGVSCNSANSCTASGAATYKESQGMGNWDYVINGKNTLSGRYYGSGDSSFIPYVRGVTLPGSGLASNYINDEAVLRLTSVVSASLVNEVRASYQRNVSIGVTPTPFTDAQVGIAPVDGYAPLDFIAVGNEGFGPPPGDIETVMEDAYQVADQVSWSHGKQTTRFGVELGIRRWLNDYPGLQVGDLTINTGQDFLLGLPGCAPSGCTGLNNGAPGVSNIASTNTLTSSFVDGDYAQHYHIKDMSAFIQDDVKLSSRLTINLGVRWEFYGYPLEKNGRNSNIDLQLAQELDPLPLVAAACAPYPASCPGSTLAGLTVPSNWDKAVFPLQPGVLVANTTGVPLTGSPLHQFAPRVGLAWQPTHSNKLVVRGGFGMYYDMVAGENFVHGANQSEPYSNTIGGTGPGFYYADLQQPYTSAPPNYLPRWVTASGLSSNIGQASIATPFPSPYIMTWNLNTQYEFLPTWVAQLGYVGSRGVHQTIAGERLNPAYLVSDPVDGSAPSVANVALRVPYVGMAPSVAEYATNGDEKYNALQASVTKHLSHGLTLVGSYAWTRAFLSAWAGNPAITSSPSTADPIISRYGLNTYYHPQRFTLQYTYELPFSHLQEGVAGKVIGGWSLSGETTIQDGTPLSILDATLGTIYGEGGGAGFSEAEFCPGMGPANVATSGTPQQRISNYFNKAAFCSASAPQIGNGTGFGNAPLGVVLGPGQNNWDISLTKSTKLGILGESGRVDFRTEFFNAFNHPQFSNPAGLTVSTASTFGKITATSVSPRLIQFGLKLFF